MPAVVVAAVQGAVAGGGIGLLTMADLVIASSNTKFNLAYTKIGATPDLGTTWHLPRLIGERRALELMLLSDEFDAARAHELGLVNFVVPAERFDAEVKRLVERIARGSRGAQEAVKRLVYGASSASLDAQLESERREMLAATVRDDFLAGVLKAQAKPSASKTTDAGTDETGR
jgi:2-(1,2-epoxy-1,2-dihydrophenyl)acetyl-CoA isomerase